MSSETEQAITTALTFKVPEKVGWSVQHGDQTWTGKELSGLIDCLAEDGNKPMTLSLSLIFELPGNDGTVRT